MLWPIHFSQRTGGENRNGKGKKIFTLEGISNFVDDMQKVVDFFAKNFFKGSIGKF